MKKTGIDKVTIFIPHKTRDHIVGYADIQIDGHFIVKGYGISERTSDEFTVRGPSKSYLKKCPNCVTSVPVISKFCWECGRALDVKDIPKSMSGKDKLSGSTCYSMDKKWNDQLRYIIVECYRETFDKRLSTATFLVTEHDDLSIGLAFDAYPVGKYPPATKSEDD